MADLAKLTVKMLAENQQLFTELKKSTRAIKRFQGNTNKSLKKVDAAFARTAKAFSVFKATIVTLGASAVIRDLVDTALAFEAVDKTLKAVTGTAESARKEFEFLERVTQRFGINTLEVGDTYSQLVAAFKSSNIEMDIARDLFETMTGTMAGLGRSTAETASVLTSFIQIANRGKVNYDEFTEQLSLLPGALGLTQRGLGLTEEAFREMLSKGLIPVEDFLVAITKQTKEEFAPAIAEAGDSARASFERFGNSFDKLKIAIANSGVIDFFSDLTDVVTKALGATAEFIDKIKELFSEDKVESLKKAIEEQEKRLAITVKFLALSADSGEQNARTLTDAFQKGQANLERLNKELEKTQRLIDGIDKKAEVPGKLAEAVTEKKSGSKKPTPFPAEAFERQAQGCKGYHPETALTFEEQSLLAEVLPDVGSRELLGEMNKDIEKFEAGIKGATDQTKMWENEIKQTEKAAKDLGFVFESRLEDAIIDMTTQTVKLRDLLRALAQDILRIVIRRAATEPLGDLISAGVRGATSAVTNYIDARGATGGTEASVNRALDKSGFDNAVATSLNDSLSRGGALTQVGL